eukprot:TRINITY_DN56369_c0_g1_i1.p1 TRINITY_DN56369_c0_g1~~TRINITY_DN56369_c0_g1_i1.p1  ORF type:complete len:104 (+),score=11.38 TRINITY_DN56369_c0_g1_i1:20-331(+)
MVYWWILSALVFSCAWANPAGHKRGKPNVGWHDAIIRVNYADTGSMQGPMIIKRRDMSFSRYPKASDVINYVRPGYNKSRYTIRHGSKPSQVWAWPEEKCFDC